MTLAVRAVYGVLAYIGLVVAPLVFAAIGAGDLDHSFWTDVLARHLPPGHLRFQYFICGPGPMMDAAERALIELGVPDERAHTERFDMV